MLQIISCFIAYQKFITVNVIIYKKIYTNIQGNTGVTTYVIAQISKPFDSLNRKVSFSACEIIQMNFCQNCLVPDNDTWCVVRHQTVLAIISFIVWPGQNI